MDQVLSLYGSVQNNLTEKIVIDLIQRTISQKQLYHFGEIRDKLHSKLGTPPEQSVQNWLKVLDIFTYGTWADYKALKSDQPGFPDLDECQTKKLKQLSLASVGAINPRLFYSTIASSLEIDPQVLESFLVDCIYDGLIVGKLDTKRQVLEISSVFGRDVSAERLAEIETGLNNWVQRTESILSDTSEYISQYRANNETRKKEIEEYNAMVEQINIDLGLGSKESTAAR